MSSERRVYGVGYKVVFTGYAGEYEVDKVVGPVDISADKKRVWEKIGEKVRQMSPDDWELEISCAKCGEMVIVDDDDKAEFQCECTTESPGKN